MANQDDANAFIKRLQGKPAGGGQTTEVLPTSQPKKPSADKPPDIRGRLPSDPSYGRDKPGENIVL